MSDLKYLQIHKQWAPTLYLEKNILSYFGGRPVPSINAIIVSFRLDVGGISHETHCTPRHQRLLPIGEGCVPLIGRWEERQHGYIEKNYGMSGPSYMHSLFPMIVNIYGILLKR